MNLRLFLLSLLILVISCQEKKHIKAPSLTPQQKQIIQDYKRISYIVNAHPDSIAYYAHRLERAARNESEVYQAMAHFAKGTYYQSLSHYELSKKEFEQILQTVQDPRYDTICGRAYLGLGNNYKNTGQYTQAFDCLYKTLKIYEKHHNKYGISSAYGCMAQIFLQKNDLPAAEEHLKKAIDILGNDKNNHFYLIFIHTLANVYGMKGNYPAALALDQEGIRIAQKLQMLRNVSTFYDNKANCYMYSNRLDSAAYYFQKCLEIDLSVGEQKQIADTYSNLGALYFYFKDYDQSLFYLNKSFALLEKIHNLPNMLRPYDVMIDVYKAQGNFQKALELKDRKETVIKQMISEKKEAALAEFKIVYETEKKEKALAQNRIKLLQKEAEARRKNYWLAASLALAFFIALLGGLIYRQQKIRNQQLAQEFQLKTAMAQIEAQNELHEQRLAISRDLHDNIGAQLTFIISSVEHLRFAFDLQNPKLEAKLDSISDFTCQTINELRDTIWAMSDQEITFEQLQARALNWLEQIQNTLDRQELSFEVDPTIKSYPLSSLVGVNCYRTIQEAIHNALKHAQATRIAVSIAPVDSAEIQISITDNGQGFEPATVHRGNGLHNMQNRIERIGGLFHLQSAPGQGTQISIILHQNQLGLI